MKDVRAQIDLAPVLLDDDQVQDDLTSARTCDPVHSGQVALANVVTCLGSQPSLVPRQLPGWRHAIACNLKSGGARAQLLLAQAQLHGKLKTCVNVHA